jgi:LysM repeat protein
VTVTRYSSVAGFLLALAMLTSVVALAIMTGVLRLPGGPVAAVPTPTPVTSATLEPAPTSSPEPTLPPQPTDTPAPTGEPGPTPALSPGGTHVVRENESLYSIGLLYGVPWELIALANELEDPYPIYVGQELVIPIPPEPSPGAPSYVVQAGDTMLDIAYKLGVDATELADFNDIEDWNTIYVGQVLLIPGEGQPSPSAS